MSGITKTSVSVIVAVIAVGMFFYTGALKSMVSMVWDEPMPVIEPVFPSDRPAPSFESIRDTKAKKRAFFDYIKPFVQLENKRILALRIKIEELESKFDEGTLTETESEWLREIHLSYNIELDPEQTYLFSELKRRVDIIPPSLALAQAAIESAWGTSRFATEANNYFGHWCYRKGCGLVPINRNSGASHEVRKFPSPRASTVLYMKNLNTLSAYDGFRKARESQRKQYGNFPRGKKLSQTLLNYSEEREHYVQKLKNMISHNQLGQLDLLPFP